MALVLNGSNDTITGLQINSANIVNGSITADDLATGVGGKILQVKQTVKTDRTTIQSPSIVDISGMSVTITPSSTSSKILVNYSLMVFSNAIYYTMRLLRDSDSTIFIGDTNSYNTNQTRGSFGSYQSSYVTAETVVHLFFRFTKHNICNNL